MFVISSTQASRSSSVFFVFFWGAGQVVGTVPMHTALYSGRLGFFKTLLAGPGGEVAASTEDSQGATPFHIACRGKGAAGGAAAMALLDGACPVMVDVSVRDDEGRTPLYELFITLTPGWSRCAGKEGRSLAIQEDRRRSARTNVHDDDHDDPA